ncbi:diacylglycerol/lipid kinase family protein [Kitasatospora brasiliensis]|uniref:diacylglycerol/lipid kinase family protein n=1 Tax=Kitasatospora brasiliensis TaxID=3058040 RepID=UPI00292FA100|nr:diacylglycerol kinase family protein [Kitasatospora sp. K002]
MEQHSRVVAIVNPAAGGDGDRAVAALEQVGTATVEVLTTAAPGDATDIAYKLACEAAPPDIVVGVGGDGTICEVVTGLYRARESGAAAVPPLLVAPAGTGNSSYRGLWNDAPWEEVAGRALRGEAITRTIDLARIEQNDHLVLLGSGSGLFAASLVAIRNRPEKGRELLMAAALAAMEAYVPYQGRVTVDGETVYEGGIVETIVGGFRYRGGLLNLVPESVVDDGLLDITLVTAAVDMNAFAQAALNGHVYDVPGIRTGRGRRIGIERLDGQPMLFEHDGEVMPETTQSYQIHVIPAALTVLTPAGAPPWFGER